MKVYEITVKGRVQGVGYRYFAKSKADLLKIKGWVKNLQNGNVSIHAEGDEQSIQTFIDYCRQGPTRAIVKELLVNEDRIMNYAAFEVKH